VRLHALLAPLVLLALLPRSATAENALDRAARAFAAGEFARVLRELPASSARPEQRLLRARSLLAIGRHAEAREALRGLLRELPHLRDLVLYLRGEAFFGLGLHREAAERFRDAARSKGSRWIYRSWQRRAEALLAGEAHAAAAEEYRHILRTQASSPRRPSWELDLALCLEALGERKQAAEMLQRLWLQRPETPAAERARKELDRLLAAGLRLRPPTLPQHLARVRALRREKRYSEVRAEIGRLLELPEASRGELRATLLLELAQSELRAARPAAALEALEKLAPQASRTSKARPSLAIRRLQANALGRLGRAEEGVLLLLPIGDHPRAKVSPGRVGELRRAADYLADHGRHAAALAIEERLIRGAGKRRLPAETAFRLAWLGYRAGELTAALPRLESWAMRAGRKLPDFSLYWRARFHARAGRPLEAEALFRELLAKHPHTYYGILARSRLAEAGKLKLKPGSCAGKWPKRDQTAARQEVAPLLASLTARHGELFPALRRVRTLWSLGMLADARRELRLIAIEVAWIASRGRPRGWLERPSVERLWRDGPLERRRFGARERAIAKLGVALRHPIAAVLDAAGVSYFGYQLGATDDDPERRRHPRAYAELTIKVAERFKLDPNLIWAIMRTESSYRLDVISRVGATGLMQIMPLTGRRIAAAMKLAGYEHSQLFEPETNLTMAAWYLHALSNKFRGQIRLIAAAYNGGPHHVARWIDMRGKGAELDEFVEEIPFSESRRYAKKILRLLCLYERLHCGKEDRVASNKLDTRYLPQPDF
jgi:soluble lytic murein transglycosylase